MKNAPAILECRNLSFAYPDTDRTVLADVSFSQDRGEIICVLGPSGCGKTTLLNLVGGFLLPDAGKILFKGEEIRKPGRNRIMVFQGYSQLFPWLTAADNVMFAMRSGNRARAESLLELAGLPDSGHVFPSRLSGGMKQRVALARALAAEPEMLLLDEPFGGLDAPSRKSLQRTLVSVRDATETSVLMVTHDTDEAERTADRILFLGGSGSLTGEAAADEPDERVHRAISASVTR